MAVKVHPEADALLHLHFCQSLAIITPHIVTLVQSKVQLGISVHFFTDGSCQFPRHPISRYSAYAIVLDLCDDDATRIHILRDGAPSLHSSAFTCVAVGRTQGEQDILRTELCAATVIIVQLQVGIIHMDSQAGIDLIRHALLQESEEAVLLLEHCDLLLQIWHIRNQVNVQLMKVKAHAPVALRPHDMLQCYREWGNRHADFHANQACQEFCPQFAQDLASHHSHATYYVTCFNSSWL
eukprot:Skav216673  [mRNA]  locus=scaffold2477:143682:144398:+ [translate_table: standard]